MEKDSLLYKIKEGIQDSCYIWAREMRDSFKDEGVLIFFILVPIFYPLLYSWIYNNQVVRNVPVAVIDQSKSEMSREFIRKVDASPDVKVAYHCNNLEEAKDLVGKQVVKGIVYIPGDFQSKVARHEQAVVSVYCDMAIMLYYKAVYQTTVAVSTGMNAHIQIAQSRNFTEHEDAFTTKPLDYDDVPIFNSTTGYGDFIIPGVLILILHQTLLLGIGLAAGTARENNRYQDLIPTSKHYNGLFRIVIGKSMCYFMIYCIIAAWVVMAIPKLFGFVHLISLRECVAIMVPFLLATIFFGMMLSCTIRYRENVMLLVVFTSVPLLFMSGVSWPQANMPGVWQAVAYFFPSTFGMRAFIRLNTMGASLSDVQVEYQALWIQTLVYFLLTCAVYRFQLNMAKKHALDHIHSLREKAERAKAAKKASGATTVLPTTTGE